MDNNFKLTDNELIELFKYDNNSVALDKLIEQYKPFILSRITYYGFKGAEREDLLQECLMGLYTAINAYKADKASFFTFLKMCVDRMLISQLRKSKRYDAKLYGCETELNTDFGVIDEESNPQKILEQLEDFENLNSKIKSALSKYEYSVFLNILNGMSYKETADALNVTEKSVDNAVQRIRTKFSKI